MVRTVKKVENRTAGILVNKKNEDSIMHRKKNVGI